MVQEMQTIRTQGVDRSHVEKQEKLELACAIAVYLVKKVLKAEFLVNLKKTIEDLFKKELIDGIVLLKSSDDDL